MGKRTNYSYEKFQKENKRKKKQAEKLEKKRLKKLEKASDTENPSQAPARDTVTTESDPDNPEPPGALLGVSCFDQKPRCLGLSPESVVSPMVCSPAT